MSVIRAFIAIPLSSEIQQRLDRLSKQLKQQMKNVPVRWVQVSNIHLTLKFLGNTPAESLGDIQNVLHREASRCERFSMSLGELDAFPNKRRPRVLVVKLQAPPQLGRLQRELDGELKRLGYPPEERAFTPHLTLGRVSKNASMTEVQQLGQMIESIQVDDTGSMEVQAVHLFRSDLYPSGPVYTDLYIAELNI